MARGGCQITTATSRIDARLETRVGAILSELLGTERHRRRGARMSAAPRPSARGPSNGSRRWFRRASAWPTPPKSSSKGR